MVNKSFIICLTGLPASGKTTFALMLKSIIARKFNTDKVSIIDPDILRQLLTPDKFDYKLEPKVREKYLSDISKELKK
ncbi:MAG: adenylyl-sulfate kinase, partial [Promethearchaeota archaeon]